MFIFTLIFILCSDAYAADTNQAKLEYSGVIGGGKTAIALIKDVDTKKTHFKKVGDLIAGTKLKVVRIDRKRVVLEEGSGSIILRHHGSSSVYECLKSDSTANVALYPLNANYSESSDILRRNLPKEVSKTREALEEDIEEMVELATELVANGEISVEEANRVIAEQNQQLDMIGLYVPTGKSESRL